MCVRIYIYIYIYIQCIACDVDGCGMIRGDLLTRELNLVYSVQVVGFEETRGFVEVYALLICLRF